MWDEQPTTRSEHTAQHSGLAGGAGPHSLDWYLVSSTDEALRKGLLTAPRLRPFCCETGSLTRAYHAYFPGITVYTRIQKQRLRTDKVPVLTDFNQQEMEK